jgi:rusticyanin
MRWLWIGGLVAIAIGTLGLAGIAAILPLGGGLALGTQMGGSTMPDRMMEGDPGKMMGVMMAGAAPQYVAEEQARAFGDQVPPGASVDRASKRIMFQAASVHLKVLGSPEGGPEMTFRSAGLSNPTISVPRGATVEVEFINGDPDASHAWELVRGQGRFPYMPMMGSQPAFAGSMGMPLGVPSSRGWPAETLSFTAGEAGMYTYLCPVPGHAQKGMHGQFLVATA